RDLSLRALQHLAASCVSAGSQESGVVVLRRIIALDPLFVPAHVRLGELLNQLSRTAEAIESFRAALSIQPTNRETLAHLSDVLLSSGRMAEAVDALRKCLEIRDAPEVRSLLILTLAYDPRCDDRTILEEARIWNEKYAARFAADKHTFGNERSV